MNSSSNSTFQRQNVTYEIRDNGCINELDKVISQLKSELFEKQQNVKDFNCLQCKFNDLLNNLEMANREKSNIECELRQLGNDSSKCITDLRTENENLLVELDEKISNNKKLYNDNNGLFHNLEEQTKDNQNLRDSICEQEQLINHLNEEKANLEKEIFHLNQIKEQDLNTINNLNNQINNFNQKNKELENLNKDINEKNNKIICEINNAKNINNNLINDLKNKEALFISKQNELSAANDTLNKLENNLAALNNDHNNNKNQINNLNNNIAKETSIRTQLEKSNQKLNCLINDRNNQINKLNNENNALNETISNLDNDNNTLEAHIQAYKKHLMILLNQNDALAKELNCILERDADVNNTLNRGAHLRSVNNENKNIINASLDNLKLSHTKNNSQGNKKNIKGSNIGNQTYDSNNIGGFNRQYTYSNDGKKIATSPHNDFDIGNDNILQNSQGFNNIGEERGEGSGEEENQYSGEEQQYSGEEQGSGEEFQDGAN